jgi:hypothetical protein
VDTLDKGCAVHDACTYVLPSLLYSRIGVGKQWCYCNCLLVKHIDAAGSRSCADFANCVERAFEFQDCLSYENGNIVKYAIGRSGVNIREFCSALDLEREESNQGIVFNGGNLTQVYTRLPQVNKPFKEIIVANFDDQMLGPDALTHTTLGDPAIDVTDLS